jgi:AcrR family transcriptional regulator
MEALLKTAAELFAKVPEPRDTREKILFTALDLFHVHGFHAVGLDRILGAVGVTKTTFYNHFESRDVSEPAPQSSPAADPPVLGAGVPA